MSPDPHTPGGDGRRGRPPGLIGTAAREAAAEVADTTRTRIARARAAAASAWQGRPPLARALALAFALGTLALGAAGAAWPVVLARRLPSALDWAAAAALLERDARPGDAVVVSPPWAERARELLPAGAPVLQRPRLAGEDLPGVRRVWLLSLRGLPGRRAVDAGLAARGAGSLLTLRLGSLELARHDLADPLLPLAFLPDRVDSLSVSTGGVDCEQDGAAFRCTPPPAGADAIGPSEPAARPPPGAATVRVERTLREVDGAPRACLSVEPGGPLATPLVLDFPAVTVGRVLRGHVGLAGEAPRGAPPVVRVSVQIDGEEAGAAEVPLLGWAAFQIDTSRFAARSRDIALVLTSARPAGALCLDAVTAP